MTTGAATGPCQPSEEQLARQVAEYTHRVTECMRAAGMTDQQIAEIDAGADRARARDRLRHAPPDARTPEMLAAAGYADDPDHIDPDRLADALSCGCADCRAWLETLPACGCGECAYCTALADTGDDILLGRRTVATAGAGDPLGRRVMYRRHNRRGAASDRRHRPAGRHAT